MLLSLYSGSLSSNSSLYNVNKQQTEKFGKLMVAFADDFRDDFINETHGNRKKYPMAILLFKKNNP